MYVVSRRDALATLGTAAAAGMFAAAARGADLPKQGVDLTVVAPELRPAARQMLDLMATMPAFSPAGLSDLRASGSKWAQPPLAAVPWIKRSVPGRRGNPDVDIYVVNAEPQNSRAAILYMHGGGFVAGAAHLEIDRSQQLARALDCTVVSVEYRLAPETRYQGSLEDNYAALKWLYQSASKIGVDPGRIAIMGESAGGGHAALLAIASRDRGEIPLVLQCLVYPMLDDRTGTTQTVPLPMGKILWTAKENAFGWQAFLGRAPGGDLLTGVPGREPNLTGLPPTWIGVGGIDLFFEEDVSFAQRLSSAAVPTELLVIPGAFHGFDLVGGNTSIAKRFTAAKLDALRRAFAL